MTLRECRFLSRAAFWCLSRGEVAARHVYAIGPVVIAIGGQVCPRGSRTFLTPDRSLADPDLCDLRLYPLPCRRTQNEA
jgi:hypothetical protein